MTSNAPNLSPASITDGTVSALLRLYKKEAELMGRQNEKVTVQIEDAWTSNTEGGWKLNLLPTDKEFEDANQDLNNPNYTAGWFGKTALVIHKSGLAEDLAFRIRDDLPFDIEERFTVSTFTLPNFYDYVISTADMFVQES